MFRNAGDIYIYTYICMISSDKIGEGTDVNIEIERQIYKEILGEREREIEREREGERYRET